MSVIKRLIEEYITSRLVLTQNRELSLIRMNYDTHRPTNLVIVVIVST